MFFRMLKRIVTQLRARILCKCGPVAPAMSHSVRQGGVDNPQVLRMGKPHAGPGYGCLLSPLAVVTTSCA